ncbi:hypothetical protein JW911_04250 [Candidatus Peregrinibacteria bacterium]|nr:hypothetical protein [Candidatus Peregrinibacteria bacterium]
MVKIPSENSDEESVIVGKNAPGKPLMVLTKEGLTEWLMQKILFNCSKGVTVYEPQKYYPNIVSLYPENKIFIPAFPVPALAIIPYTRGYSFPERLVKRVYIDDYLVWENIHLRQNPKERISIQKQGNIRIEFFNINEIRLLIQYNREGFKKLGLDFILDEDDPVKK